MNIIRHDIAFLGRDSGATLAREKLVTRKIDVLLFNLLRATPHDCKDERIRYLNAKIKKKKREMEEKVSMALLLFLVLFMALLS